MARRTTNEEENNYICAPIQQLVFIKFKNETTNPYTRILLKLQENTRPLLHESCSLLINKFIPTTRTNRVPPRCSLLHELIVFHLVTRSKTIIYHNPQKTQKTTKKYPYRSLRIPSAPSAPIITQCAPPLSALRGLRFRIQGTQPSMSL